MTTPAYNKGYQAYSQGVIQNPYRSIQNEWDDWRKGWNAAAHDSEAKPPIEIIRHRTFTVKVGGRDQQ